MNVSLRMQRRTYDATCGIRLYMTSGVVGCNVFCTWIRRGDRRGQPPKIHTGRSRACFSRRETRIQCPSLHDTTIFVDVNNVMRKIEMKNNTIHCPSRLRRIAVQSSPGERTCSLVKIRCTYLAGEYVLINSFILPVAVG